MDKISTAKMLKASLSETELNQLIQTLKEEPHFLLSELISLKRNPVGIFVKDVSHYLDELNEQSKGNATLTGSVIRNSQKFTQFEFRILSFTISDIEAILVELLNSNEHINYTTCAKEFLTLLQGYLNESKFSTLMENSTLSNLYNS